MPQVTFTSTIKCSTVVTPAGKTLRFTGGVYVTDKPDEIEMLDALVKDIQTSIGREDQVYAKQAAPEIAEAAADAAKNTELEADPAISAARNALAATLAKS